MYLSILRGINVSGKNSIKMDALKKMYEGLGFTDVITYIQSGNVIFNAKSAINLNKIIETKIKVSFDYDVPVIILTKAELSAIVNNNPFVKQQQVEADKLHITFLAEAFDYEKVNAINSLKFLPDEFFVRDKVVYVHCPSGYGATKLNNNFFEKKFKATATTRNWKTVNELLKLIQ